MAYLPYVIEQTPKGERQYDIYSRLLLDRIVFLGTEVNDQVANSIVAQFLFLDADNPDKPINFYINSPGGSVYAGLAIYDVMQMTKCEIKTFCTGISASMAALLLASGTKGLRYALPHSRIMIHQPLGGAGGQASDIEISAREIMTIKGELNQIMANHTGKTIEEIEKDTDRDYYLTALQAQKYGLIDEILAPRVKGVNLNSK